MGLLVKFMVFELIRFSRRILTIRLMRKFLRLRLLDRRLQRIVGLSVSKLR